MIKTPTFAIDVLPYMQNRPTGTMVPFILRPAALGWQNVIACEA